MLQLKFGNDVTLKHHFYIVFVGVVSGGCLGMCVNLHETGELGHSIHFQLSSLMFVEGIT